jgi:hypothetical protein
MIPLVSWSLGATNPRPNTLRGTTVSANAPKPAVLKNSRRFIIQNIFVIVCRARNRDIGFGRQYTTFFDYRNKFLTR